jgi:nicotinamide-nucleotide amidase
MQVELASVGTELLLGQIVDTNAAYLAGKLSELGITVYHKTTVGDNAERLAAALRISLGRSDVVLATGGLGPTDDDITAAAVAEVMGVGLVEDEATTERIRSFARFRGVKLLDSLLKQALVPKGAEVIPNPVGTAPGFIISRESKTVITLPGVPTEMRAMAEESVFPYLAQRLGEGDAGVILSRVLRIAGMGESQAEAEISDLIGQQTNPTIAPLAKTHEVFLRLTARAPGRTAAERLIAPVEAEIRQRLGNHVYGADEESLELVVGRMLEAAALTLAVAESCTGGLIGHRITGVPGSSRYFLCSVTAYSNESKVRLLGLSEEILRQHGAVSAPAAAAMAEGVRKAVHADIGMSVTGIAGPDGGKAAKPVGLVYLGLADADETVTEEIRLRGDRAMIKERAAQMALYRLYRTLRTRQAAGVPA